MTTRAAAVRTIPIQSARPMGDLALPFDWTPERVILAAIVAVLLYQFVSHIIQGQRERTRKRKAKRVAQLQAMLDYDKEIQRIRGRS